jgi:TonB-dependent SusC/RagA subfamily outer membrane receptor
LKIGFETVFENQTFNEQLDVILKKEEPKLEFFVESFRNKIQPGSSENWSFQLKATNTTKEAEILVSMYDSSLDQFTKTDWETLSFNNYSYNNISFRTNLGFDKASSFIQNLNPFIKPFEFNNEETKLIWFGFDFNQNTSEFLQKQYKKALNKKSIKPLNSKMISGVVSDEKLPLPGVSVVIKGSQRSTNTDFDGNYEIEAAIGEELVFSFIGFESKEIIINSNVMNVQLEQSNATLNEVVVVGYGSQKKVNSTRAIARIEDNTIFNSAEIDKELQGKVSGIRIRGAASLTGNQGSPLIIIDGEIASEEVSKSLNPSDILSLNILKDAATTAIYGAKGANGVIIITTKKALQALTQVKARKNLSETAFFYPNLKTDSKGKLSFNFTSPEALTAWKLRLLAHNKDAVSGYLEKSIVTQKELMVVPNFPRFFREKDSIVITAKVANMTNEAKTGMALLQLFDTTTMQTIDAKMGNNNSVQNFNIAAFGNTTVSWKIYIPEGLQGV